MFFKNRSRNTAAKVVISGWYGHHNAGDDAILEVFITELKRRINCSIDVLSELPENILLQVPDRTSYHLPILIGGSIKAIFNGLLLQHIKKIYSADLFVLGGGGLLRDNTTWKNLFRLLDEIWIAKLFGRKVALYAIGVGPLTSHFGKKLIGLSVNMCDLITVRDQGSVDLLLGLGIKADRIMKVADPAFLLEQAPASEIVLEKLVAEKSRVGFFPTWHSAYRDGDLSQATQIARILDRLQEEHGMNFVCLPMQVAEGMDDVKFGYAIKAAMRQPQSLEIYEQRLTPGELKWATAQFKFNLTVRLHAMIFSLGTETPVVAINYEPKVEAVFSAVRAPEYLVSLGNDLEADTMRAVENLLADDGRYQTAISAIVPCLQKDARITFSLMADLLPGWKKNANTTRNDRIVVNDTLR